MASCSTAARPRTSLSNLWDDAGYAGIKRDLKELLLDQLLVNAPRREPRLAPYA